MTSMNSVKRNPPSPGFKYLANGAFSSAYYNEDTVENIVSEIPGGNIDLSKHILQIVWEKASENAKRFIPEIRQLRVTSILGETEVVYKSKRYTVYDKYGEGEFKTDSLTDLAALVLDKARSLNEFGGEFEKDFTSFLFMLKRYAGDSDYNGISEYIGLIIQEVSNLGLSKSSRFDITKRNIAFDGQQLILLDPFYCLGPVGIIQRSQPTIARYLKGCLS